MFDGSFVGVYLMAGLLLEKMGGEEMPKALKRSTNEAGEFAYSFTN